MDEDLQHDIKMRLRDWELVRGLEVAVIAEIISIAEAREILGLPPVDEGD